MASTSIINSDIAISIDLASSVTFTDNFIYDIASTNNQYESFIRINGETVQPDVSFTSNEIECSD